MCENCTKAIARIVLIIVNLIFMLAGLLMLAFSVAAFVAPSKVMAFFFQVPVEDAGLEYLVKAVGVFGIILGSIVVVVAFFGFVGAACENLCFLAMYLFLIILILLAQIALIITAAVLDYRQIDFSKLGINTKTPIDNFYLNDIQTNMNKSLTMNQNPWTKLQLTYKCCGMRSYTEYASAKSKTLVYLGKNYTSLVPLSCCTGKIDYNSNTFDAEDIMGCTNATNSINEPCINKLENQVKSANKIILGIAAGIVGVELLVMIFASILIHNLRQEKNAIV